MVMSKYSYLNSTSLIDNLANSMGTLSNGSTPIKNITNGTLNCLISSGMQYPTYCGWASTQSNGVPYPGFSYNSKELYKASIDMNNPVGVYIGSSSVTTPGYPNGIQGAHMMTGIGYLYDLSVGTLFGDYINCYTTQVSDGVVLFPHEYISATKCSMVSSIVVI